MIIRDELELEFEQLDACPVCGSVRIPNFVVSQHYGMVVKYCRCEDCRVLFLNPRMSDEQTTRYYISQYRDIMREGTQNFDGIDLARQRERPPYQIGPVKHLLDGAKTALEIGCSAGYLMQALADLGMECVGIEADERYHKMEPARHFELYRNIGSVPPRPFDLIAMSHVLEHMNHPVEYLTTLAQDYAHPGTKLLVEVPNIEVAPNWLIHHPLAFTAATLKGTVERAGWQEVLATTHGRNTGKMYYLLGLFVI